MNLQTKRHLLWESCYNARDMGGFVTKDGQSTHFQAFIRSDNLSRLTPEGRATLVNYGVGTIVDLRSDYELDMDPPQFAKTSQQEGYPNYINLPLLDESDKASIKKIDQMTSLTEMYYLIIDKFQANIGLIMTHLAQATRNDGAVLFHCHSGRDRTGLIAAFLLWLVGVEKSIIADDYALSNEYIQPTYSKTLYKQPEIMLNLMDYIEQKHGGITAYLLTAGVAQEDLNRLVTYFLE